MELCNRGDDSLSRSSSSYWKVCVRLRRPLPDFLRNFFPNWQETRRHAKLPFGIKRTPVPLSFSHSASEEIHAESPTRRQISETNQQFPYLKSASKLSRIWRIHRDPQHIHRSPVESPQPSTASCSRGILSLTWDYRRDFRLLGPRAQGYH